MSDRFNPDAATTPEEETRVQELLAELGLATFNAQAVEYGLVSLLAAVAIREGHDVSGDNIRKLMDTRYSQTMGQLVRQTARSMNLHPDSAELLEIALKARNWLAHHFYRQFAPAAFDERLRIRALALLRRARQIFEATQDALRRETLRILSDAGMTAEEVSSGADAAIERYIDAGLDPNDLWNERLRRGI